MFLLCSTLKINVDFPTLWPFFGSPVAACLYNQRYLVVTAVKVFAFENNRKWFEPFEFDRPGQRSPEKDL